jgi:hypothetical protein
MSLTKHHRTEQHYRTYFSQHFSTLDSAHNQNCILFFKNFNYFHSFTLSSFLLTFKTTLKLYSVFSLIQSSYFKHGKFFLLIK